jgi:MerR family transcriptional regulator, copper efflux regulator
LKIGELAAITNVSKRTIDYYSTIGLLKPQRSSSNYRYYDESSIERLRFIEECKKDKLSLEEIKGKINAKEDKDFDCQILIDKMKGLEQDVSEIISVLETKDIKNREYFKKNLSHESITLIQTLLLLLL